MPSVPLPMQVQIGKMRIDYRAFRHSWSGGASVWTGEIQPSPISRRYTVQITYRLGHQPEVEVLSPQLRTRSSGEPIPHQYQGGRLCLFLPGGAEWHSGMSIADTIPPWISHWLLHYEVWLTGSEWQGGGAHPRMRNAR